MIEAPAALSVTGLRTRYGGRDVLRGVDLEVARGEVFGLLGPNGAGKTTLIRAVCGRVQPLAGTIRVVGRPVERRAMRHIGLVPQEVALYPHLTARENLQTFGRLSGLDRRETDEAVAWAGEAADIAGRLDERIAVLSGGWKRRVNIAAAILHRPALLILDEPTVGVDIAARHGLHGVIQRLSHAGMGVLLATHDLDQAELLCARVGFLRDGVIDPQGPPRALIDAAFHDQREIIIELRRPPSEGQATTLARSGFTAASGDLVWVRMGRRSGQSAAELSAALEQAGLGTREIRFREPGLDSLFLHLARGRA
ncbi:MAG TPA: ABC transporter ATP-binding protein, partial [Beijerinckiaceae bacterium]